jgi:adenine phosphoribosyltransferase
MIKESSHFFKDNIADVPDFPKDGINYKDISPVIAIPHMFRLALLNMLQGHNNELWAGVESRGFIFAAGLSGVNGGGVLMIRKKGKLPPPVIGKEYSLEYGTDTLEVKPAGERKSVVLVDDVLATGGTLKASYDVLKLAGYNVLGIAVFIDLQYLHEEDFTIDGHKVHSAVQYKELGER